jgi:hypothetical protein
MNSWHGEPSNFASRTSRGITNVDGPEHQASCQGVGVSDTTWH